MKVQVFGPGCAKCVTLYERTKQAVAELGLDVEVEKVTEIAEMVKAGVMSTPALAIDGKIRVAGKVPSIPDIKGLLAG
jgi:small redox-active disulfide protein 2